MRRPWLSTLVVVMAAGAWASSARAQDLAAAEALFREGRELMQKGDLAAGCAKLAESQRLDPSSGTLLNLASCHEQQGKLATAWAEYLAAARLAQTQGRPERVEEAKRRAGLIEPKLSYLTVRSAQPVEGQELRRGGVVITPGSRLPTDPGSHQIVVSAPGYQTVTLEVKIGTPSDEQVLEVPPLVKAEQPPKAGSTAAPPAASGAARLSGAGASSPPQLDEGGASWWPYAIGGTGVVLTGVGAAFGVMALGSYADAEDACPKRTACSPSAMELRSRADVRANIANVGLGLGLVGVGVGAYLLLTSEPSAAPSSAARRRAAPGGWARYEVLPLLERTSAGVGVQGAF